ncbi:MAG: hypothetical protein ACRD4R_16735 [Candidatus Acidiferrales bacterium]
MQTDIQSELNRIIELIQQNSWHHLDFWITAAGAALSGFGLRYSIKAFNEAKEAKMEAEKATKAAKEAGKIVRVQTVSMELADIAQKLGHLQPNTSFANARELLGDAYRRLLRAVAPFAEEPQLRDSIATVKQTLEAAQHSLESVRPATPANEEEAPNAVYNGVEATFARISYSIAELSGLFEKQTF